MKWVVNTDSAQCRIYEYKNNPKELSVLYQIAHPENKEKNQDFVTDRPGHYNTSTTARGSYSPETGPKEIHIEKFAKEIAHKLEEGRVQEKYTHLIIIALPHMNGLIHQNLNKHVSNLVEHSINKDFVHITDKELLNFLKDNYI